MIEVLIVGAGPAGWALADSCARLGLRVTLVAPRPHAPWRPTYGLWEDEVFALPAGARWVSARARVVAGSSRWLERGYAVLDNESVRSALTHPEVTVMAGRAVALDPHVVTLADGRTLHAEVVINATGGLWTPPSRPPKMSDLVGRLENGGPPDTMGQSRADRGRFGATAEQPPELSDLVDRLENEGPPRDRANGPFARRSPHRVRAEQSAYGVFVSPEAAAPLVAPGEAVFMDWRQPMPGPATFLYAVPTPDGRVLLEETSLAARPGLPMGTLRERLHARLAQHGISPGRATERVRFPVDRPPTRNAFGAAAGITHPATGYGVGDMFALAPAVADAIARGVPVHRAVWSPQARAVHRLRRAGLRTVLALPPDQIPHFFALFFGLPPHHQRAYLSGRADAKGTAQAMAALFRVAPWSLRRHLVAPFR